MAPEQATPVSASCRNDTKKSKSGRLQQTFDQLVRPSSSSDHLFQLFRNILPTCGPCTSVIHCGSKYCFHVRLIFDRAFTATPSAMTRTHSYQKELGSH